VPLFLPHPIYRFIIIVVEMREKAARNTITVLTPRCIGSTDDGKTEDGIFPQAMKYHIFSSSVAHVWERGAKKLFFSSKIKFFSAVRNVKLRYMFCRNKNVVV
jgi:hypothetical protein